MMMKSSKKARQPQTKQRQREESRMSHLLQHKPMLVMQCISKTAFKLVTVLHSLIIGHKEDDSFTGLDHLKE